MIYFDNSATTPIHPEVLEAMQPYLKEQFGNPSGKYYLLAENAKRAVDLAREQVATLLNSRYDEVVFTSGATESNNLIIKGLAEPLWNEASEKHMITTKTEHSSVLEPAKYLSEKGFAVHYLEVDHVGKANLSQLEDLIRNLNKDIFLISVIWGNSELGTLNDMKRISELCSEHELLLHSDATQVIAKTSLDLANIAVPFLSFSSHKLNGPKGIGACVIRKDSLGIRRKITPLFHGGGQEYGYRSGTLAVHNIVGFGTAAAIAYRDLKENNKHLKELEIYCKTSFKQAFPGLVHFNIDEVEKIPGIINLRFDGVNNELLIKQLAEEVAVSTGSACSSSKPSHVLQSIGLTLDQVRSSIRISFSRFNTFHEIDEFIRILKG